LFLCPFCLTLPLFIERPFSEGCQKKTGKDEQTMSKKVRKQGRFTRDAFKLDVRITTSAESTMSRVPVVEPAVYDDDIDVSKIDLSDYMSGENRDLQKDGKNTKGAGHIQTDRLDPMKQYMEELSRVPLISKEQEAVLAEQIHSGDPKLHDEACQALLLSNLRLVVKIAHDFKGLGLPLLDLISEGNLGLARAVEKFNPKLGAKFSSYAAWWVKQAMRRAISNQSGTIRIPVQSLSKMGKIKYAALELKERLGRNPTDEEIAQELGLTEQSVMALRLSDIKTISISSPIKDGEDGSIGDLISDSNAERPDEIIGEQETFERLISLVKQLDERERTIIVARFGLDGKPPRTLDEVSSKLGRTRERVRQIQNQALNKLKAMLGDEVGIAG
ncbi:MAG: RNA polymerase sigma factor RpoD/SigA, partial [Treponema sp.]|nr:RNA polymerase sigma factor RpoD/SigA [Treponema sp.]